MKNGFTLVELSIVLVIIGLLIGGILVGQSLIESVKIQQQVKQLTDYNIAIRLFKDKFNGIPGDSKLFSGNGNGIIESSDTNRCSSTGTWDEEMPAFFEDLAAVNFGTTFDGSTSLGEGYPTLIVNEDAGMIAASRSHVGPVNGSIYLCMRIGFPSYMPDIDAADGNRTVSPIDALAIDKKMDDANATTGSFMADQEVGNVCHTAGIYNNTNTNNDCRPAYSVDPGS